MLSDVLMCDEAEDMLITRVDVNIIVMMLGEKSNMKEVVDIWILKNGM
ncbi:hypothetical protein wVul_0666 [Wolbachia endosymbiont of Armadillidium vulgare str. wVulC]|nr:hypothetical protein [Wolbachia endosymbiont of Armadillidium vulgare]KLT22747.1 hypothetical protein wVul_0666 [Wolbachia endosymbiont of Armadillidium vulgare str. wVulC]